MRKINFKFPEIFKYKFNREPKNWTIEQLHDLYFRTKDRALDRSKICKDIVEKIKSEIIYDSSESGYNYKTYLVYFYQESNKTTYLRQYKLTFHDSRDSYSYSINDPKLNSREERLDFILANGRAFELGQEFYEAKRIEDMAWKSMWVVKSVMWEEVESKLREIYKYGEKYAPDTLVIQIGEKQYFVHVDNSHGYSKFQLKDENVGYVIKM
jgi:hypothetical protein